MSLVLYILSTNPPVFRPAQHSDFGRYPLPQALKLSRVFRLIDLFLLQVQVSAFSEYCLFLPLAVTLSSVLVVFVGLCHLKIPLLNLFCENRDKYVCSIHLVYLDNHDFSIYFTGKYTWRRNCLYCVAYSNVLGKRCLDKPGIFSSSFSPLPPVKDQS